MRNMSKLLWQTVETVELFAATTNYRLFWIEIAQKKKILSSDADLEKEKQKDNEEIKRMATHLFQNYSCTNVDIPIITGKD